MALLSSIRDAAGVLPSGESAAFAAPSGEHDTPEPIPPTPAKATRL
jgi:hypothetical protein